MPNSLGPETPAAPDLAPASPSATLPREGKVSLRWVLFALFFISGFCGLVYQLVWTRMAFAAFGIITPVLSVVISVFMLGLSVGAWAGGKWIGRLTAKTGLSAALYYGLAELGIGLGAFAVPRLFALGQRLLQATGESNSGTYLTLSALVLAVAILPWCLFMGTTYPFMMAYMREREDRRAETFSFLYLANVLGATSGIALAALVLIEVLGFRHTLWLAAAGNFTIALISCKLGWGARPANPRTAAPVPEAPAAVAAAGRPAAAGSAFAKWVLFTTGFVSMAMEVVWTRAFAPILKTQVYSFAAVVAVYLAATFVGSCLYRRALRRQQPAAVAHLLLLLCMAALVPILANEACFQTFRLKLAYDSPLSVVLLLLSICPFCGLLGYLTPRLVDDVAAGSPAEAGVAYALNVLGCILGPLFACYLLLSSMGDRQALLLLGLPCFGFYLGASRGLAPGKRLVQGLAASAVLAVALGLCHGFEEYLVAANPKTARVRRDYAASVMCLGQGFNKWLVVNGVNMTALTPVTKFMAHLPLAYHQGPPTSALVICFGMGTTFRSALSWDVNTTAIELVPSVAGVFDFFFADAPQRLANPKGRVVIDDGRRFMKRTAEKFDVIIVDPPPPVEAAGSSLLYSKEFFELAAQHLKPGGIIQTWVPEDLVVGGAVLRSLGEVFPHVRCFGPVKGRGVHMLASQEPLPAYSPAEVAARLPAAAQADLLEWSPTNSLPAYLGLVLNAEYPPAKLLPPKPGVRVTDDHPYNEYFLLRKQGWWGQ